MTIQGCARDKTRSQLVKKKKQKTKLPEEPRVSGALIRSMLRKLAASRSEEPSLNGLPLTDERMEGALVDINISIPPCPRKLRRKRLHSFVPFRHRFFNMAQARREIVAALKLHRTAMNRPHTVQSRPVSSGCLLPCFTSSPMDMPLGTEESPPESALPQMPAALHPAMSDEEMAVIRSIAELHDVELSDSLCMAEPSWWCATDFKVPPLQDLRSSQKWSTDAVDSWS